MFASMPVSCLRKKTLEHSLADERHAWLQLVSGQINLNGTEMLIGDGAEISEETLLKITAQDSSEFLLFDLN